MNRILLTLVCLLTSFLPVAEVYAISQADREAILGNTPFYDPNALSCDLSGASGLIGDLTLPEDFPPEYAPIFSSAADAYDIDVGILIGIFWKENGESFPPPQTTWPVSPGGAKGPFQFLDGTWDGFGVDGDGDGVADVNNLIDAAHGAANFISFIGGKTGIPLGSLNDLEFYIPDTSSEPYTMTIARVFKSYNAGRATWRSDTSGLWVRRVNGSPTPWDSRKQLEINDYVRSGVEMVYSLKGGDITTYDPTTGPTLRCIGAGSVAIIDGLAFPLQTTQSSIKSGASNGNGGTGIWCWNSLTNCHGQYNAEDIHDKIGVPVVAAVGGTIAKINPDSGIRAVSNGCPNARYANMSIFGDDGNTYYYQHLTPGSTQGLTNGDRVEIGQQLGTVGDVAAAWCTAPHLHFDVTSGHRLVSVSRSCVIDGTCLAAASQKIDVHAQLVDIFNTLEP
jgi:hypothetical protein